MTYFVLQCHKCAQERKKKAETQNTSKFKTKNSYHMTNTVNDMLIFVLFMLPLLKQKRCITNIKPLI